jgi:hypothetical protein
MFTGWRGLFAMAALVALGLPTLLPHLSIVATSTVAKHTSLRGAILTGLIRPSSAGGTCTIPRVVGSFSGRVMYSSLGRGFSADPAVSRAVDARIW